MTPAAAARSTVLERGRGGDLIEQTTLPGGLRVVTESVPGSRSASIGVWVAVGSADETPALAGASHYLEHVLFKGTDRRDAAEIAGAIDIVGGDLNAFTAHEYTCFYAHVLAEDAAMAMDVVCDVVTRARIDPRDVETERSVILDEIAMRDDDPVDSVAEAFAAAVFGDHPSGDPVAGSTESITGITREQVAGYYRDRYDPAAMVVAVAGGVRHDEVVGWVRSGFDGLLRHGVEPEPVRVGPGYRDPGASLVLLGRDFEQVHLTVGVPASRRHGPDKFIQATLSTALGGGMSSRLFQTIREENGLAYTCYAMNSAYADAGSWSVYTACHPENLDTVAGMIGSELADVAANGITADELALAQGQLCGGMVLGLEDMESRMNRLGRRAITLGRHVPIDDELAAIRAVTLEQVRQVARDLLARPMTVAVVGPYDSAAGLPGRVRGLAAAPLWAGG